MLKNELSEYQQELGDKICSIVATHTESLEDLVKMYELPPVRTIYDWLYRNDAFSHNYAKAKQIQAQRMIEELDKIAKEKSYYVDADGNQRVDPGYTASQRLIADTRKFIASKLVPKVYGDKQTIEQTVTVKHEDALKDLQ
jgi:hypothetical protein